MKRVVAAVLIRARATSLPNGRRPTCAAWSNRSVAASRRIVLVAAIAAIACADSPADPAGDDCPDAGVTLCTAPREVIHAVLEAVDDVDSRLLPALTDSDLAAEIESDAAVLTAAISNREVTHAVAIVGRMRQSVREAYATFPGDAPDLSAIDLALDATARLLE